MYNPIMLVNIKIQKWRKDKMLQWKIVTMIKQKQTLIEKCLVYNLHNEILKKV